MLTYQLHLYGLYLQNNDTESHHHYLKQFQRLGYVSEKDKVDLEKIKIIGDALTSFYDRKGQVIENSISKKMLELTIPDLEEIENVIVLASGSHKNESTKALLKTGVVDYLIIDMDIVRFLDT